MCPTQVSTCDSTPRLRTISGRNGNAIPNPSPHSSADAARTCVLRRQKGYVCASLSALCGLSLIGQDVARNRGYRSVRHCDGRGELLREDALERVKGIEPSS